MAIKLYTKQYAGIVPDLFESRTHFLRSFGGTVQVHADAEYNDKFLTLKTTDTDVTIQAYSTDPNVAFETGTGNSNRFGPRHEVKSVDTTVEWETPLAIHDGIDRFTVNDIPEQVVAERLALHGAAWAEHVDGLLAKALSDNASETLSGELTEEGVVQAFADARKAFVNNKVSRNVAWVAYVNTDVFNLLVDSKLATTAKNSSANIDNQTLYAFKGFLLQEIQDDAFQEGEQIYFAADGVGVIGIGIETTRVLDSEDFNGVALQGAGKYGKYIPAKNQKAILKATLTETPAG